MTIVRWTLASVVLSIAGCGMETKRVDPDQDDALILACTVCIDRMSRPG